MNKELEQKNYLGDVKWVLYQYICDLNCEFVTIRCGSYAYDKLNNMSHYTLLKGCTININGEEVAVRKVTKLSKKQIIITPEFVDYKEDTTVYPDDIVLYFA